MAAVKSSQGLLDWTAGPLIVVVGQTASGKSALAMEIAQRYNGEIVCADAWTVYTGFDIGTAKPTAADRRAVPHHLLDVADPATGYSVAQFKVAAQAAIADILQRGKLPILVGGSGLYIDAVLYDYQFRPLGDPKERDKLNDLSLGQLQAQVAAAGIDTTGVDVQNKRRLIRLIETGGPPPQRSALRANTIILGLQLPKTVLQQRITDRVDQMVEDGFIQEVTQLANVYGWDNSAMNAPGYRAFRPYIEAGADVGNPDSVALKQAKALFIRNDLQLAKKQRTWFKRNSSIQWLDDPSKYVDLVTTFLNKKA